ncbi:MAG: hypothetical protein R3285_03520 [Kiloniellales bacterium]|nr:hypothetical protein [Kiloniellales bacterium]
MWALFAVLGLGFLGHGQTAGAQSCTELSGAPFCGTQRSHTTVGSQVIFPQGPPARRVGNYLVLQEGGKQRLAAGLPPRQGAAPEGARPAGRLIGLNRGRDFGAFAFPTGTAGKLSGRP